MRKKAPDIPELVEAARLYDESGPTQEERSP